MRIENDTGKFVNEMFGSTAEGLEGHQLVSDLGLRIQGLIWEQEDTSSSTLHDNAHCAAAQTLAKALCFMTAAQAEL